MTVSGYSGVVAVLCSLGASTASAGCPLTLPQALFVECVEVEGAGGEYPWKDRLVQWQREQTKGKEARAGEARQETSEASGTMLEDR